MGKAQELDEALAHGHEGLLSQFNLADQQTKYNLNGNTDGDEAPVNSLAVGREKIGYPDDEEQSAQGTNVVDQHGVGFGVKELVSC